MTSVAPKTLNVRIRERRERLHIDQAELARRAGVHKAQVMRWEAGTYHPLLESIIKLARALEVSVDDLIDDGPEQLEEGDRCMVVQGTVRCSLRRDHRPAAAHDFAAGVLSAV
jgi:transcriptional regulator with XRE-family HTH domain